MPHHSRPCQCSRSNTTLGFSSVALLGVLAECRCIMPHTIGGHCLFCSYPRASNRATLGYNTRLYASNMLDIRFTGVPRHHQLYESLTMPVVLPACDTSRWRWWRCLVLAQGLVGPAPEAPGTSATCEHTLVFARLIALTRRERSRRSASWPGHNTKSSNCALVRATRTPLQRHRKGNRGCESCVARSSQR